MTTEGTEAHGGHGGGTGKLVHELLTRHIIGVAMDVHRELGPGLIEFIYEECLCLALQQAGHSVERQRVIPVEFRGHRVSVGLRLDIVVDNAVVIEVKSIEALMPIHEAQLLTYLKIGGFRVGLLLNFNVTRLTDGMRRLVR